MSSVPYIAPWATTFTKYATQLYTPSVIGSVSLQMTIPVNQWWRIIYVTGTLTTTAAAGNRVVVFQVQDSKSVIIFLVAATDPQAASNVTTYLFTSSSSSYTNKAVASSGFSAAALPDLLWPPSSVLTLQCTSSLAGDAMAAAATYAVEVYTESERPGVLQPLATPLIS